LYISYVLLGRLRFLIKFPFDLSKKKKNLWRIKYKYLKKKRGGGGGGGGDRSQVLSPKSFFQERSSQKPSAYTRCNICLGTTGLDPCSHDITHIKVYHNNVNSPPPQGILKMLKQPDEKQDIE
jgi:hypothetical protein